MKTIGRVLIILAVFAVVATIMVTAVNASSAGSSAFNGSRQFRSEGGDGFRPGHEGRGAGGAGWIFGPVKNIGIMAILVTLIAWPKSIAKKKKRRAAVNPAIVQS